MIGVQCLHSWGKLETSQWKLAWFGRVTHTVTASPKPSFRAPWRVGDNTMVSRRNIGWMDNVKEWTFLPMLELLTMASCRKDWKRIDLC